jgi:hypothetical protein
MTMLNLRPETRYNPDPLRFHSADQLADEPVRAKPRKRAVRRPVFDCVGGCGKRVSAWNAKDAACPDCLPALMPAFVPPPLDPGIDPADIPF